MGSIAFYPGVARSVVPGSSSKDPTGFADPTAIAVSYNATNRTITLTGTLDYYFQGTKYTLTSPWTSSAHDTGNGTFFLSSADGITFSWSTALWNLYDIQVAVASVNGSNKFALRECHGCSMGWEDHRNQHLVLGTYKLSGGLADGDTYAVNTASDAANTPGFTAAVIVDEDLTTTIPAWAQGTYTTMYIGGSAVATFDTAASLPFRSSGSFLLVNNATAGTESAASNNRFCNVYQILLPAAIDSDSQKYRTLFLQPQVQYTSLAAAQAEDARSLALGNLSTMSPEYVFHTRITYVTATGDNNTGKCRIATGGISYLSGSRASQVSVSGFTSMRAENITVVPTGSPFTATDVQTALEELHARITAL